MGLTLVERRRVWSLPNPRQQRTGVFSRYWLVSATEVMQVLCGWRVMARR
jgi:hypothetical protein